MLRIALKFGLLAALVPSAAMAQDEVVRAPGGALPWIFWLAPGGAILALCMAYYFYRWLMKQSAGDPDMIEIAGRVREGAFAYLRQQYKVVGIAFFVLACILGLMAWAGLQAKLVPFAFLTGGFFSGLSGFFGMNTATNASARTAAGARQSLNQGLQVAFRSGAVMGLVVVGLGLLDISAWFMVLWYFTGMNLIDVTVTMLCFGMGASTQALFARVGGGIFTKAADVGADLVGKVEAGIPEDDPRNPATIADNVGDNVGDVAGMGADLYESYCGSILATAALGVAAVGTRTWMAHPEFADIEAHWMLNFLLAPLAVAGVGVILSLAGIFLVKSGEEANQKQLMAALFRGINGSSAMVAFCAPWVFGWLLPKDFVLGASIAVWAGLLAGIIIGKATEYYTSDEYKPTQEIAKQTLTGPATTIIDGIATGMLSTWVPVIVVGIATLVAYGACGGFLEGWGSAFGLYGVGMGAVGMLSTLGLTLATDAYGPIADNAGGNAEMTHQEAYVRERTDALDSLGNTTAATGKGFAIGSAALTALALLAAYMEEVRVGLERLADKTGAISALVSDVGGGNTVLAEKAGDGYRAVMHMSSGAEVLVAKAQMADFMAFYQVHLMNPKVLVGVMLGSMAAFLFCALTMKAVGRAAGEMVDEVRRQFREDKGIMEGTSIPDYARCVAISTKSAQREMVVPSLLAIIVPVATGCVLGVPSVVGLLIGGTSTGFVLAVMMANSGGAWDNAKKYIEKGNYGGKGSDAHKAGVVGDTVGDPFKDTSGPSLNILIKLMSMVSVVFAGLTVWLGPIVSRALGLG